MNETNLSNGEIKEFRDKLNNNHVEFKSDLLHSDRFEIYSVLKNNNITKIGDLSNKGIVSDFFIDKDIIYVRYANVLRSHDKVKIKKNVSAL